MLRILPSSFRAWAHHPKAHQSALRQKMSKDKRQATSVSSFSSSSGMHLPITQFNEDEQMTRNAARQWAREELKPIVRDMDNEEKLRPDIIRSLFDNGFMGMEIPEAHGGSELSFTSACLVVEEISRVDPSVAILVDIHNTLTNNAVRFWGSEALQQKWLPRLARDSVSSFALSEAGSGSDAFSMKTTATQIQDGSSSYLLNGSKLWISNAPEAGVFLVFANAAPEKVQGDHSCG
ncbi:Acyl-CoA dehydrogenase [Fragilaria crotonensis]|nr:Acyl-CoA dehydrogenase [Fragilaria crotonensis]